MLLSAVHFMGLLNSSCAKEQCDEILHTQISPIRVHPVATSYLDLTAPE